MVQKWARLLDLEKEKDGNQSEVKEIEEEIIINLGKEKINELQNFEQKRSRDVATQDNLPQLERYAGKVFYSENRQQQPFQQNYQSSNTYTHNRPVYRHPVNQYNNPNRQYQQQQYQPQQYYPQQHGIFRRPPPQLLSRNMQCTYCGRLGHQENNCRKKLNTCFLCGSSEHHFYQCNFNRDRAPETYNRFARNRDNTFQTKYHPRSYSQPRNNTTASQPNNNRQRRHSDNQFANRDTLN